VRFFERGRYWHPQRVPATPPPIASDPSCQAHLSQRAATPRRASDYDNDGYDDDEEEDARTADRYRKAKMPKTIAEPIIASTTAPPVTNV